MFITVLRRASHWAQPTARMSSTPSHHSYFCFTCFNITSRSAPRPRSSLHISQLKLCMHFSTPLCVLRAPPFPPDLIIPTNNATGTRPCLYNLFQLHAWTLPSFLLRGESACRTPYRVLAACRRTNSRSESLFPDSKKTGA
jgi:hypothetical protein